MITYTDWDIEREEAHINNPPPPLVERLRDVLPLILGHLDARETIRRQEGNKARSGRDALARCMRVSRRFYDLAGKVLYADLHVERPKVSHPTSQLWPTNPLYNPTFTKSSDLICPLRHTRRLVLDYDPHKLRPSQGENTLLDEQWIAMPKLRVARMLVHSGNVEGPCTSLERYLSLAPNLVKVIVAGRWPVSLHSITHLPRSAGWAVQELVLVVRIDSFDHVDSSSRPRIVFKGNLDFLDSFTALRRIKLVLLPIIIPGCSSIPVAAAVANLVKSLRTSLNESSKAVTVEIIGMDAAMNPCSYGHQDDKRTHDVRGFSFDYEAYKEDVRKEQAGTGDAKGKEEKDAEGLTVEFITIGEYLRGRVWPEELTSIERSVLSVVAGRQCKAELGQVCRPQCNYAARHG